MKPRIARSLVAGIELLLIASLGGCNAVRQEYRGYDAGQVWTAMQAVAHSPEYRDWHVVENNVYVDRDEARIRIQRTLERSLIRPGARPWDETQIWRFQISLLETDPPTVRFTSSTVSIPAQAQREGHRFFAEVRRLLDAGEILPEAPPRPSHPEEETEPPPAEEETDPVRELGDLLEP